MPPQVNPAGSGCGPIPNQASVGAEEVKSGEAEKKPAQQQREISKNGTPKAYRATSKEASNRKAELSTQATAQKVALNGKLETDAGKSEKAVRRPSAEASAEVMRDFHEVNGEVGRGKPSSAEVSAEVMRDFREVNDDAGRGKPPSAEVSPEIMRDFREVNGDSERSKQLNAEVSAEVMRDFREVNGDSEHAKQPNSKVRKR